MDKRVVDRECFEVVETLAENAYIGRGRFDWSKVQREAHRLLDERFGESQVELCVEKCKG
ncbi:hypothetical protein [Alteromonas gracilis]|uniref:hypothetical protein n=1 Tax=Alteromonas gracilis TaxID=1479524 RepID=UPI002FE301E3